MFVVDLDTLVGKPWDVWPESCENLGVDSDSHEVDLESIPLGWVIGSDRFQLFLLRIVSAVFIPFSQATNFFMFDRSVQDLKFVLAATTYLIVKLIDEHLWKMKHVLTFQFWDLAENVFL